MIKYIIWIPIVILIIGIIIGIFKLVKSNSELKAIEEIDLKLQPYYFVNKKYKKYATGSTRVATGKINLLENEYIKENDIMFP